MANVTLTGSSVIPLTLSTSDNFYMASTGSLLVTSGTAPAIGSALSTTSGIDAVIEGRIVNMNDAPALQFHRALSTDIGRHVVTLGASAFVSSWVNIFDAAISMVGNTNSVINFGRIHSDGGGIEIVGANGFARNDGTISALNTAIQVEGDNATIINSGQVLAPGGLRVSGANTRIENSGRIEVSDFNSTGGIGGVQFNFVSQSTFLNTGHVSASNRDGLLASALPAGNMLVENSGTLRGSDRGIEFAGSSATLTVQNAGLISGGVDGINVFSGAAHILNTASGRITSLTGDALEIRDQLNLLNHGEITASGPAGRGIVLGTNAGFSNITNHGLIATTFLTAIDASALLAGGAITVVNHGTIQGGYSGSGASDVIRNFGTMDIISTNNGADILRNAGLIDSVVLLGSGDDLYRGHLGRVEGFVDGGPDNDTLLGGAFEDDLNGGSGNDLIEGRDGDDTLTGSLGADIIFGGNGNDVILGGSDQDQMSGGSGADTFVFTTASDISTGAIRDRIGDFRSGDKLDMSAFMDTAKFIGSAAFTGTGPEIRYTIGNGQVIGDHNGDGLADWTLILNNRHNLILSDLIL